jgi:hypothetical protein
MTFSVTTTVHRNPKSDTKESAKLTACIRNANAGAWLGYLRLGALQEWVQSINLDIQMSNDGGWPTSVKVSLDILPPDRSNYKHEFSAPLPLQSGFLDDWIAGMIDDGTKHYFARVRHSAKVSLDTLDQIGKSFK